ncbi:MAG: coproporphyrinogen-III oxidase family protein, partial [Eubacteriales bacterium]|nr:coproporphyrinogen-III oxidase family protein [Eubacteriales bacterium]
MKDKISLYVHIPFCMSKCSYCSFISRCATKDEIEEYFKFLNVQIIAESAMVKDRTVATIYFGGGTPSFVDEKYIVQTMNTLRQYYKIDKDAEITIECNPCSVTVNKLKSYKRVGVNRISFGVQSLNDDCLKIIGRKHNRLIALDAIKTAQKVGFVNISADLLIGIPNQTQNMLIKDIKTLSNLGIKHISAYMLMLEKGTKLYEQVL